MAEPLKYLYNKKFIASLCAAIELRDKKFDSKKFTQHIFDKTWEDKELKERMRHITKSLREFLPSDYRKALTILKPVSKNFSGFEPMFFPDFVEVYGLEDYTASIQALEHFTKYSSSEFAVRPFIEKYPKKMMTQMAKWALSKNHHVRRLATEGCRPRLPWAMALPAFKKDPKEVLKILEKLKNDDSEYVRRSVANNLNDISKDHVKMVVAVAKKWKGKNPNTDWVVKHACRTLLKQGLPDIMQLFGYRNPKDITVSQLKVQKTVKVGDYLSFSFELQTKKRTLGNVRLEYAIDFMKKNGKQARKVFKISEADRPEQKKEIVKKHSFKVISTRKYYVGLHGLAIIVNGHEQALTRFKLLP